MPVPGKTVVIPWSVKPVLSQHNCKQVKFIMGGKKLQPPSFDEKKNFNPHLNFPTPTPPSNKPFMVGPLPQLIFDEITHKGSQHKSKFGRA